MEGRERIDAYLARISVAAELEPAPTIETLRLLQTRHLLSVPFENLDIHWKRPIVLDIDKFYAKIVEERRGGFCYELNGLFNDLLKSLGFNTRLVSARVFGGERGFGPEFDHAAIIVTIGELEYLADVGFGDFAAEPLRLIADIEQRDREGDFVIRRAEFGVLEAAKKIDGDLVPQYRFEPIGRDLSEFAEMCDFQQYSPKSHFTKGKLCSIMTDTGRKTLTDTSYIETSNGERREIAIDSEQSFAEMLKKEFGIELREIANGFRNKY